MNIKDGEIREYDAIPRKDRDDKWSKPFSVGQEVVVLGVRMKISKIKKLRKELHLVHHTVDIP
jgi:hypothetical protein